MRSVSLVLSFASDLNVIGVVDDFEALGYLISLRRKQLLIVDECVQS